MDKEKHLIKDFEASKVGRVLNGKESFRNKVGRIMHGMAYKHRELMILAGLGAAVVGVGLGAVGTVALAPVMFAGVYGGISPKKNEKAACEALANIAVRKASAFVRFLNKQKITDTEKQRAVRMYLEGNLPIGMKKIFAKDHPLAITQILSGRDDLVQYHSPELYQLEVMQELLTQNNEKGGIVHGFLQPFTQKYYQLEKQAKEQAALRWQDRLVWEKMPEPKPSWLNFQKTEAFKRKTGHDELRTVFFDLQKSETKKENRPVKSQTFNRKHHRIQESIDLE